MRHFVGWLLLSGGLACFASAGVVPPAHAPGPWDVVTIAPAKTSICLGVVSLKMQANARSGSLYSFNYAVKVFPYFFYNEQGRIEIPITDEALRRLDRGQTIDFVGRAVRNDGTLRQIQGRATPVSLASGRIKVRVFITRSLVLSFNTTYSFGRPLQPMAAISSSSAR